MAERIGIRQREPDAEPEPEPAPPAEAGPVIALQRAAGNAAVTRWLVARDQQPGKPASPPPPRVSYVFLMGDTQGDNFYIAAREFFANRVKNATMVLDKRTLAEVIQHVNAAAKPVDTLFVVSHANQEGNLGFSVDAADQDKDRVSDDGKPRSEFGEIKEAREKGRLPQADTKLIDDQTKIQIKGCNIGRSELMLDEVDKAFGGKASVTAPTHTQEYRFYSDGKGGFNYEENLSEMFLEDAGLANKSKAALAAAFKAKYPMIPEKSWKGLLGTVKRETTSKPRFTYTQPNPPADTAKAVLAHMKADQLWPKDKKWVVTYAGRTRAGTQWRYEVQAKRLLPDGSWDEEDRFFYVDVPPTDDALIAQEKAKHGRPDAYKWSTKPRVVGDQLEIDVIVERTEWIIPDTIRDATGPVHPPQTDPQWFKTSTFTPPAAPPPKP